MPDKRRDGKVIEGPWLTAEDKRLLQWLVEGRTTREIAEELGVSPSTVRRKIESIANKTPGLSVPPPDA
jgi:DNA-binding CsgD family transcriptional regulator